ncbi:hypothetical protein LCGC14_0310890 [marine sediment metagenome]|uniref:Uncharacterized protein n=1 Tax=marine sediment metagenome TaxID=412755 RepID=A0A0F9W9E7_9ZZZZ
MKSKEEEWEDWEERQWSIFMVARRKENAEASVALSHEADCDCGTCKRVRRRALEEELKMEMQKVEDEGGHHFE